MKRSGPAAFGNHSRKGLQKIEKTAGGFFERIIYYTNSLGKVVVSNPAPPPGPNAGQITDGRSLLFRVKWPKNTRRAMELKEILSEFKETAAHSLEYLRQWKSRTGGKILGCFCTNTPEELIHAAGFLPVRILSSPSPLSLSAKHLQSYSCSLVQSTLEAGLRGDLSFFEGAVFPHTCDSIQRLSDIWARNLPFAFHWDVVLPVKLHTESARTYLLRELARFRRGLEELAGSPVSEEDLAESIALFNRNRALFRKIYDLRSEDPALFSAVEFYSLALCAAFLPKEEANPKLQQLLDAAAFRKKPSSSGLRLFIAGSVCQHFPVFDLFDHGEVSVVGDDLCTGRRHFAEDAPESGNPLEALAARLLRRVPCPCKHNPEIDRAADFLQRIEEARARGVVFLLLKYCDPHAFDYPYLKEKLDQNKIPSLLLEIEPGSVPLGALDTRLKAFVETLGG
jgi:benzoyl-CoA reductase subunit C